MDHQREADRIISARARGETLAPITDSQTVSMADAYAIQRCVTADRLAQGERVVGWKLGYTSKAMRAQMGIDEPNFGPLTNQMVLDNGALLPGTVVQPKVEPEVALRFARPLKQPSETVIVPSRASGGQRPRSVSTVLYGSTTPTTFS